MHKTLIYLLAVLFVSPALTMENITRGFFRSCTKICAQDTVCDLENDNDYRFCLKFCSHKFDMKTKCSEWNIIRPILPYEQHYKGAYNTNHISLLALDGLDENFILQTSDRRRALGTAKTVLLVRDQVVHGNNVQLREAQRINYAEDLLQNFFKYAPAVILQYKITGTIPDNELLLLFTELKKDIISVLGKN
jgi:hypothetical protein